MIMNDGRRVSQKRFLIVKDTAKATERNTHDTVGNDSDTSAKNKSTNNEEGLGTSDRKLDDGADDNEGDRDAPVFRTNCHDMF